MTDQHSSDQHQNIERRRAEHGADPDAAPGTNSARAPWFLRVERFTDRLFDSWRTRTGRRKALTITPYAGYASSEGVKVLGRVMEERGEWSPLATDSRLANLQGVGRLFATHECPFARATIALGREKITVVADEEGYLSATLPALPLPPVTMWDNASAWLEEASERDSISLPILRVGSNARFGVISDIDDTVMQTGAENVVRNLWTTFTGNALSRHVYEGVPELYRGLAGFEETDDTSGARRNPIFYLSSSPWNLYTLIHDVLAGNGVPWGPIFLRDFGLDRNKFIKGTHGQHKIGHASRLLSQFDGLPFILIGDLGQADAEVYAEIVRRHGRQVAGVILHQPSDRSHEIKRRHVAQMEDAGVPTLVTRDYREAIAFARARHWIE